MNSKIKELLSNTLLFAIANMGSKIMVFLMVPLYTAVLTTNEYGIADMVQTTATMLIPILTAMIADAVLRFCFLKEYSSNEVVSIGIRITMLGTMLGTILCVCFIYLPFFKDIGLYVLFIPALFLSNSMANLFHKYSRGIGKVKASATAGLLSTFVLISLNLLFLLVLKIGVLGYLMAYAVADFSAVIYMAIKDKAVESYTTTRNVELRKEMLKYSIPLVPNSLSWWAISSVNRYVMLAWLGVDAVGIYSATLRIPSILTVLCDIFAQAWLLSALKGYGSDESKRFICSMHNKYFTLLILLTASIILLAHPLAKILLSGDFSQYWWVTPYLFISVFYGALVGFLGSIFSSERKNTMQFVSTTIGAIVSIMITVLFLNQYGVSVVAISTMVGYYVIWLIRRIAVNKYLTVGYGTINSSLQGIILLVEAVLVGREMYLWALLCVIALVVINTKEMLVILRFGMLEIGSTINRKNNKL